MLPPSALGWEHQREVWAWPGHGERFQRQMLDLGRAGLPQQEGCGSYGLRDAPGVLGESLAHLWLLL